MKYYRANTKKQNTDSGTVYVALDTIPESSKINDLIKQWDDAGKIDWNRSINPSYDATFEEVFIPISESKFKELQNEDAFQLILLAYENFKETDPDKKTYEFLSEVKLKLQKNKILSERIEANPKLKI